MPKRPLILVKHLTFEERYELLKDLLETTDVIITGAYGSSADLLSDGMRTPTQDDKNYMHCSNDSIIIETDICSG